jgi:hypothetical protein
MEANFMNQLDDQKFFIVKVSTFVIGITALGALAAVIPKELRVGVFIIIAFVLFRLAVILSGRNKNNQKPRS